MDDFFAKHGLSIKSEQKIDNLGMAMSLVASTRAVTLLPRYAKDFLTWSSVTSRPIEGEGEMIDLVVGYNKANRSPVLQLFLSRLSDIVSRINESHV
ncbi:LysR substrate-binding domain-containing protein [Hyphomicrobium sp. MC8b]|uniref:LysR substrate-binding domain-containing protein n=1 Tax=Hyphomicrobium sp. MC8b TaxID=300273 RepID=UPI003918C2D9